MFGAKPKREFAIRMSSIAVRLFNALVEGRHVLHLAREIEPASIVR